MFRGISVGVLKQRKISPSIASKSILLIMNNYGVNSLGNPVVEAIRGGTPDLGI